MSVALPKLTFFPWYRDGATVQAQGTLTASSAFYTRQNQFTPGYAVNIPPNVMRDFTNYLALGNSSSGRITQKPTSQIQDFNRPLGLGDAFGSIRQTPVPAVAPAIPNVYRDMVDLMTITDAHYADLMAQPSFRIPTIGLGLKVTTDGLGGVDKIEISPSSFAANPKVAATGPASHLLNETNITAGAMVGASTSTGLTIKPSVKPPAAVDNQQQTALQPNTVPADLPLFNDKGLGKNAGIFNLERLAGAAHPPQNLQNLNSVQQRLFQLQPPQQGLPVAGVGAVVAAEQSKQIATVQARLDVNTSNKFKDNVASLASGGKQAESYAAAFRPQSMDGRIPLAPSLPNSYASAGGASTGGSGSRDGSQMGGAVADATSRRGRGGYIPFQMHQEAGASGAGASPFSGAGTQGGMSFGGGQGAMGFGYQGGGSLMSGGQGGQARQQRRPLAFSA